MTIAGAPSPDDLPWINLDGADNVRDLGGLPAQGGGRTRFGRLLRSGTLQDLTPGDVEHLLNVVGVRTVVDLRLIAEAEREGSALSGVPALRYLSLPLWSADRIRSDEVADPAEIDIVGHYFAFLDGSDGNIVSAARSLADAENLPAIIHCAAGKDRTGVLAAVLLDAVGVTGEAIAADYALTSQRLGQIRARLARLETYRAMLTVPRGVSGALTASAETMETFLAGLHERYGGGAAYLSAHGMTGRELAALRSMLIEH